MYHNDPEVIERYSTRNVELIEKYLDEFPLRDLQKEYGRIYQILNSNKVLRRSRTHHK